jgi:hypothetical protein
MAVAGSVLLVTIVSGLVLLEWRPRPYLLVGWFWFLGLLVPVLGLVQVGAQAMADRYTYLPLVGIFIMLAWTGAECLGALRLSARAGIAAGVLLLVPDFAARIVGLNGLLVFMVVYFFQGIAIVAFYFRKKQVPRVARLLFYGIIGVQQVVMLAVIGVGFFDTWFNFRKLGTPLASH